MGLLALILSVVIDAIWPLLSRPQEWLPDDEGSAAALDDFAADPLVETPYDPLVDAAATAQTSTRPAAQAAAAAGSAAADSQVAFVLHPLERHALRLIDAVAGGSDTPGSVHSAHAVPASLLPAESRHLSLPGWLAVVGLPVVLVGLAEVVLDALGGFFVFLLHVAVLYLTVGLGAFHRRFSELQLLIGAGEARSARLVLARWIAVSGGAGPAGAARAETELDGSDGLQDRAGTGTTAGVAADSAMPLAGLATAQVVLAAFRDVFAPLFWYAVLPGATGPVLYLFARFAACHSFPFAGTAYRLLDWIPLRLAALGFALVGQFEDTVFCLRSVGGIGAGAAAPEDPYLHQRLLLLPVTGGALGFRLTDAGVDTQLRVQAPELDLPGVEREAASLRPISGLLLRSVVVWIGIYLLVTLLT